MWVRESTGILSSSKETGGEQRQLARSMKLFTSSIKSTLLLSTNKDLLPRFFLQLNHFQAVLITDGTYTFVKYNFPEDGLNWATPGLTADDSQDTIKKVLGSGRGWFPMGISGYSSGDWSDTVEVKRDYVDGSNQITAMDIDNMPGNYPGKPQWWSGHLSLCQFSEAHGNILIKKKKKNFAVS